MLERIVPQPEAIDEARQAGEYGGIASQETARQFVDDLLSDGCDFQDVLDIPTGTARTAIELCRRVGTCRVMAADMSPALLDLARYHIEIQAVVGRVQLDQADAQQMPYKNGMFDLVMSYGGVHQMLQPATMLREALRVTTEGGCLFVRDLLRPVDTASLDQLVELHTGVASDQQQHWLGQSLRAALSLDEIRSLVGQLGFDPQDVRATSDLEWTWAARKITRSALTS